MRVIGGCLLVLAALLSACGGDDDADPTATTSAGSPTEPTVTSIFAGSPTLRTTPIPTATDDISGQPFDICSVLTAAEAEAVIGTPIGSITRQDDLSLIPPSYVCEWMAQGDNTLLDRVRVEGVPGDQAALDDYYDDLADAPVVPDLGIKAHYDDFFGLEVMMDGYVIGVTVITEDYEPAVLRQHTVDLGRIIVDRMD